jgi:hypothetical protein
MKDNKVVTVSGYTKKARDPKEMSINNSRAVRERWRRYYAQKKWEKELLSGKKYS